MKIKLPVKLSLKLPVKHGKDTAECTMENGRLSVMCSGCGHPPDIGSGRCVACICSMITKNGEPERIILRSGKDTEYFGPAVSVMNALSRVDRLAATVCGENVPKRCSVCSRSAPKLIGAAWSGFPEPDLDSIRSILNSFDPSDERCSACMMRTYSSVEQIEYALDRIGRDAAKEAFSLTEV
jgi:hypothetical protein